MEPFYKGNGTEVRSGHDIFTIDKRLQSAVTRKKTLHAVRALGPKGPLGPKFGPKGAQGGQGAQIS